MHPNIYENTARFYDIGNDRGVVAEDIEFYSGIIPEHATVLEVGCGTGRVSLALAKRGNTVTGIDLSQPMLDVFQNKLNEIGTPAIPLYRMDMRNFDLQRTFDWILFPFRVFQALISDRDRRLCLEAIGKHMTAKSRLILTLFNPLKSILDNWGHKNVLDFEHVDGATGQTIKQYTDQLQHDQQKQIISATLRFEVYEEGVLVETLQDALELGYLYPAQCPRLFAASKLVVVDAFAGDDRQPLREDEQRERVYILKKAQCE